MALSRLDQLYRQIILDHSSRPRHYGKLDNVTETIELNNPTCGDVIQLQVVVNHHVIEQVAFTGHGCSISTASASMMTELMIGKTLAEAKALCADFSQLVQGQAGDYAQLGDAALLSGVAKFPARIKCATLSWKALEQAAKQVEEN